MIAADTRVERAALALEDYEPGSPYLENWAMVDCLIERLGLEAQRELIARTFRSLCGESLRLVPKHREERTSVISHARLPLEYSFTTEEKGGALRLLTEVAPPALFLPDRYRLSVQCLKSAQRLLGHSGDPGKLDALLEALFPENMAALDEPWYNGVLWLSVRFAEGAKPVLRVYANQQINNNSYRFGKLTRALRGLGLVHAIELVNLIEEQVERWGMLSGISFDLFSDGRIGGVKVFLGAQSSAVGAHELEGLTRATGLSAANPALATFLSRIGLADPARRATGPALLCSIALPDQPHGARSIKLDATVQGLFPSDAAAYGAADDLMHAFRVHPVCLRACEDLFFAEGLSPSCVQTLQYVGVQVRSDGKVGVNVYLSPGTGRPERQAATPRIPSGVSVRARGASELQGAVQAAARFLLRRQSPGGGFWDLAVSVGSSGPWLTGLVGEALLQMADFSPVSGLGAALARAADYLERAELPEGGHGYNEALPPDCDTTAHAIWFLARLGRAVSAKSREQLLAFRNDAGGFLTYVGSPPGHSWGTLHHDVHPAGVRALAAIQGDPAVVARGTELILEAARTEPIWPAFWWTVREYGIYVNLACLEELGELGRLPSDVRERIWARQTTSDPLRSALTLLIGDILKVAPEQPTLAAALERLLRGQLADGGWTGSHALQVVNDDCPAPWEASDPATCGPIYIERKRLFTTALAMRALARHGKGRKAC